MIKSATRVVFFLVMIGAGRSTFAAPPGSIPVYCSTGVGVGFNQTILCRRADTRVSISPIPSAMFFHITDIVVNPNNTATSGVFTAIIGRDAGGSFPGAPSLDLIGSPAQALHFTTSHIVLRGGEDLFIANFAASDFPIDVRVSGYLSTQASP